jgi:hypothetical protein
MTLKMVFVGLLGSFFVSSAFAMPMAGDIVTQSAEREIEKAAMVCDAWGQCYQTYPNYGAGYGGYYRGYGGYGGGYYRRGGGWDRDDGYRGGWGRHDWDGRDWHGGRWGEW